MKEKLYKSNFVLSISYDPLLTVSIELRNTSADIDREANVRHNRLLILLFLDGDLLKEKSIMIINGSNKPSTIETSVRNYSISLLSNIINMYFLLKE